MQLILEDGSTWHFPNSSAIRNALAQLDGLANSFLILERDQANFMQAAGVAGSGLVLEHRAGDDAHHYQAQGLLDFEAAAELFESYAAGTADWHGAVVWQPI
jgi:hypothetical protein